MSVKCCTHISKSIRAKPSASFYVAISEKPYHVVTLLWVLLTKHKVIFF